MSNDSDLLDTCGLLVSFGWTVDRLETGIKIVTRRKWKDNHTQKFIKAFNKGLRVKAFDKDQRYGGHQIGWLRLTQEPYRERLADMPEADVIAEGFPELTKTEFIDRFFEGDADLTVWVIRFNFEPLFVSSKKTAGVLFCGIGGADIGLQQSGFDIAWAIERDPVAAEIYSKNFPHSPIVEDIRNVDPDDLDSIDLLWASPPCQQYSQARDKSLPVHEGADLGYEVIRFLEVLKPRYFCLENVPAYKSADSFKAIVECLNQMGYWSNWIVVNAADYGVPQSRQRLILRAVRGGWLSELPLRQSWKGWYDAISDLVPQLPSANLSSWQIQSLKNIKTSKVLIPRDGARNYKKKGLSQIPGDRPAPTIRAMSHDGHCYQFNAILDINVLKLTPRCYARFQSFPDTFWLPDRPVDAIKGIGNAVPCLLAEIIAKGFYDGN